MEHVGVCTDWTMDDAWNTLVFVQIVPYVRRSLCPAFFMSGVLYVRRSLCPAFFISGVLLR